MIFSKIREQKRLTFLQEASTFTTKCVGCQKYTNKNTDVFYGTVFSFLLSGITVFANFAHSYVCILTVTYIALFDVRNEIIIPVLQTLVVLV